MNVNYPGNLPATGWMQKWQVLPNFLNLSTSIPTTC